MAAIACFSRTSRCGGSLLLDHRLRRWDRESIAVFRIPRYRPADVLDLDQDTPRKAKDRSGGEARRTQQGDARTCGRQVRGSALRSN